MTPTTYRTIPELVVDASERYGDLEALVDGDVTISYADLSGEVDRAARGLMALGLEHGDRVAIWAPNCWEWVVIALGTHVAGGVVVPINTRFKAAETEYVLRNAGVKVLATVTDFLDSDYVAMLRDRPEPLSSAVPSLERIVVLRGHVPDDAISFADVVAGGESVSEEALAERTGGIGPDDLCHIMFTSGTTGSPKGVMLAHEPVLRGYESWSDVVGLRQGDRYLVINPYFHSFGLNAGILACLLRGATNLPHPVFDVAQVMGRVVADRISMLPGPPAIFHSILNHPDLASFDMSTLRLCVTGAAAIPVELIERMRSELGFETIITGYGLTEASGIATMCRHDDDAQTIATTSGRAIPDVEVVIVNEDGKEVPRGEPGELVVRGYNVMKGYLDDPEQTAEAIDADGWLHTGDVAVMDERGYVQITDRLKDMFITGGFNAYPAEIESLMLSHPGIGQVAVIGIPDERMGEVGMAFVVPRPGVELDEAGVIAWSRDAMANYKVPRRVSIVSELPLISAGKVNKIELREIAART